MWRLRDRTELKVTFLVAVLVGLFLVRFHWCIILLPLYTCGLYSANKVALQYEAMVDVDAR